MTIHNYAPDLITIVDSSGRVTQRVRTDAQNEREKESEIIGCSVHSLFHQQSLSIEECDICQSIFNNKVPSTHYLSMDGKRFEISLLTTELENKRADVLHICRDLTQQHVTEKSLNLVSRLYNMLRLTNQAIFKHKDEHSLLQELCDIAINSGQFELAWFGVLEKKLIVPFAYSGKNHNYVKSIKIDLDNANHTNGPVARALRSNSICYVNNTDTEPGFKPWRKQAQKAGFKSLVVMPWEKNGQPIGIFALYAPEPDAFDFNTLDLIENLSNDISHILRYIESEKHRRRAEKQLTELSSAIEQSESAILITDFNLKIEYVNPYFCTLNGYRESDLIGRITTEVFKLPTTSQLSIDSAWANVRAGKRWEGELFIQKPDGDFYWAYQSVAPVLSENGEMTQVIWTSRDSSELHNAQQTIAKLAFYDTLTDLPNRRLFHDRMHKALQFSKRRQRMFALLFFDIDGFKAVNDIMGHDYGDLLLQHMAKTIKMFLRESDTVSRLGGDEFTLILQDIQNVSDIETIAQKVINELNKPAQIGERTISISTSIGVSVFPTDGQDLKTLLKKADMAMYHAKNQGKNTFKIFDDTIAQDHIKLVKMQEYIKLGVEKNEFSFHFQPQFRVDDGSLIGVEALLRWYQPKVGWITPTEFINVAEQSDLIISVDKWVINKACQEMKVLIDQGFPKVKLAINISAIYFKYAEGLISAIEDALNQSNFPPHLLQIEITEGSLVKDVESAVNTINAIKSLGISLAIDDFGTGYSSLAYLKRFPVDLIKIDRSFINDLENDITDRSIVNAVISMAHSKGLCVLAEGVETQNQLKYLSSQRCDFFQGYLYAKPMEPQKLLKFMANLDQPDYTKQ